MNKMVRVSIVEYVTNESVCQDIVLDLIPSNNDNLDIVIDDELTSFRVLVCDHRLEILQSGCVQHSVKILVTRL
tara:strand:- start:3859 stop:4080 length:222 start_codon:yes stop_codon:yes gene_type:complete